MVSESDFIQFVAGVLDVPVSSLTMDTAQSTIVEWDSMAHLRLIMEVQDQYGVQIPLVEFKNLRTIRDLYVRLG